MIYDRNYKQIRNNDKVMIDGEIYKAIELENSFEFIGKNSNIVINFGNTPITKFDYEIVDSFEENQSSFTME